LTQKKHTSFFSEHEKILRRKKYFFQLLSGLIIIIPLYSLEVFLPTMSMKPGQIIRIYLIRGNEEKNLTAYENGNRRILYRDKSPGNAQQPIYFFFCGYDGERFPEQIELRLLTSQTDFITNIFFTADKPPEGKVHITDTNTRALLSRPAEDTRQENIFFHKFFSNENPVQYWRENWICPVYNPRITSPYGMQRTYNDGLQRFHRGVDYGAPEGTPVYAPNHGVIVYIGRKKVRGKIIVIDHGSGLHTEYWHLSEISVKNGQLMKKGDVIGRIGNTGLSTGPHLHWGVRVGMNAVDGLHFLEIMQ